MTGRPLGDRRASSTHGQPRAPDAESGASLSTQRRVSDGSDGSLASVAGVEEQADVVAGAADTASGVVVLATHGPRAVTFSTVNGRAIVEGDIELGAPGELEAAAQAVAAAAGEMQAAVVADASKRWPGATVPFDPVPPSAPIAATVARAMDELSRKTPARFRPRTPADVDFVAFEVSAFCSSRVGRVGGRQAVRLSPTASPGNAVHELCHTLGLWHEQSRRDRDTHIEVVWGNILPGYEHNFTQQLADEDDIGAYDFRSVMHYPPDAFSRNGQATLRARVGNPSFGQRDGLSDLDAQALDVLYPPSVSGTQPNGQPGVESPAETQPIRAGSFGIQFEKVVPPSATVGIVTTDWPVGRIVHWDVACTGGMLISRPLVSWQLAVGRSRAGTVDYYFTIESRSDVPVTVQGRYLILREA